jgi:hypothetical protein
MWIPKFNGSSEKFLMGNRMERRFPQGKSIIGGGKEAY